MFTVLFWSCCSLFTSWTMISGQCSGHCVPRPV